MIQYIDKSALIAEIERRIEAIRKAFNEPGILSGVDRTYANAQYDAFKSLLTFLNTLEVKDVDLEKELNVIIDSLNDDKYEHLSIHQQLSHIARHFYELGLKAKGE
jgi:hypothetical protein